MEEEKATPQEQVRRLYEDAEGRTATAVEELVARDSFGELLARMTENVMAITRIGGDALDLAVRNLRLAGRQDVTRLARQLARTEDKLETVLQEVERLQERLEAQGGDESPTRAGASAGSRRSAGSSSRSSRSANRSGSNSSGRGTRARGGGGGSTKSKS
jgi:hypothetical protein